MVHICPACGHWFKGDLPQVNAEYGRQLIGNGLAQDVLPKAANAAKPTPTG